MLYTISICHQGLHEPSCMYFLTMCVWLCVCDVCQSVTFSILWFLSQFHVATSLYLLLWVIYLAEIYKQTVTDNPSLHHVFDYCYVLLCPGVALMLFNLSLLFVLLQCFFSVTALFRSHLISFNLHLLLILCLWRGLLCVCFCVCANMHGFSSVSLVRSQQSVTRWGQSIYL